MKATATALDKLFVTSLGAGYSPFAPGTMGAIVGIVIWLVVSACGVSYNHLWMGTLAAIIIITLVSINPINRVSEEWGEDPSRVVIDETVGVWICLLAVPYSAFPKELDSFFSTHFMLWVAAAFILFRFFDILKPLGIRKMERYPGGWGVMADDILSGVYGLIVMSVIQLFVQ